MDYFQHLDLCFEVRRNNNLNALQQRYKSRTTTELQKYDIMNRPNICAALLKMCIGEGHNGIVVSFFLSVRTLNI